MGNGEWGMGNGQEDGRVGGDAGIGETCRREHGRALRVAEPYALAARKDARDAPRQARAEMTLVPAYKAEER